MNLYGKLRCFQGVSREVRVPCLPECEPCLQASERRPFRAPWHTICGVGRESGKENGLEDTFVSRNLTLSATQGGGTVTILSCCQLGTARSVCASKQSWVASKNPAVRDCIIISFNLESLPRQAASRRQSAMCDHHAESSVVQSCQAVLVFHVGGSIIM